MKHFKFILLVISFIFLATSCTEDEQESTDCYTCETTQVEYCYTIGNTYYQTTAIDGSTSNTELNGTWSDTIEYLTLNCGNTPQTDCYTCEETEYCYTTGLTYYTITVSGSSENMDLNGETWTDLRAGFVEECGDDGGELNGNIVGTWLCNDYHGTSTTNTTMNGTDVTFTTTDTFEAISFDNYTSVFTENPNETYTSGSMTIHHNVITNGITSELDTPVTAPNDIFNWEIQGNILISTPIPPNFDEATITITELSETTLKTRLNGESTIEDENGNINESVFEIFMTFERQ